MTGDLGALWVVAGAPAVTMAVTPFLNIAAAVLIMRSLDLSVGHSAGVQVDAMLVAVAVGASCDFLTPIGHLSKTIVMGPGAYRFFYCGCLGAPMSALVLVLGSSPITLVWE